MNILYDGVAILGLDGQIRDRYQGDNGMVSHRYAYNDPVAYLNVVDWNVGRLASGKNSRIWAMIILNFDVGRIQARDAADPFRSSEHPIAVFIARNTTYGNTGCAAIARRFAAGCRHSIVDE